MTRVVDGGVKNGYNIKYLAGEHIDGTEIHEIVRIVTTRLPTELRLCRAC